MMTRMPDLSRRAVLRLGAGAAVGAVGAYGLDILLQPRASQAMPAAGTGTPLAPPPPAPGPPRDPAPPAAAAPTMVTGSFVSAARGGVNTNWAIARPPGQTKPLRPVIALHGKGSDAATVMAGGVEQGLAQAVNAGLPPFAVVAVDGGGSYWHKRSSGEDSGAMVLDELIPLLGNQGLDTSRVAFLGWSMGGYGALLLGGRLGPARTAAICAVSPALWLSSGAAAPGAFDGPDDFAANSVFGMPALGSIPIRVDCGDSDPFYAATKQFIAQLPNPPAGGFSPGGHNPEFWSSQLPAELSWMAPLLTA
ncbi:alpha/beta hydrolase-fold protein [Mycobacterium avium]|jgi:S-formylglutathione hydrolase FrmB|uniref:Acyl-CoA:diacylglycerol acyltransferase n=18 Tax=Mycobacterium avium complex (MAC) TaxID=120793 RepID=A0A2A3LAL9_MYCAV|nr:alpha/beta hydrolase-fold protein [Mycobacterium avium]EUA40926.1 esterase family protein [Mycobacterium avium subsp. avium 2285 (R)]TXA39398.1 alpha/beta hydrolase [Mycobacterium tuberculosis variant bovis]ABK68727.1 putative esterase superfamily protein [Mycobacterium avium 104]ANR92102.1 esterase [Mycobacterium avium]APT09492.1 alpha/beta hydrolase [Mycobacterium avium subsp. hominissuis]